MIKLHDSNFGFRKLGICIDQLTGDYSNLIRGLEFEPYKCNCIKTRWVKFCHSYSPIQLEKDYLQLRNTCGSYPEKMKENLSDDLVF